MRPLPFSRAFVPLAVAALAFATTARAQSPVPLASPNPEENGSFGEKAAGVPDVDGDGAGDFIVGAVCESNCRGRAYVFSGATGVLLYPLVSPNAQGETFFAYSVSGVDDLDGDGAGDLLVGTYSDRAYVFSGATGALLYPLVSPNPQPSSLFGSSVSGVGDVDGDGRGDLLVGAFREDFGASDAGRAYVFSGATGALLHVLATPNPEVGGLFGYAVSGVTDVDGDGVGDLLVGAHHENPGANLQWAGRAYVFSGATGAQLYPLVSPGPEAGGGFGSSVSGVEDVDGDGRGDLLVGAPGELGAAGQAHVFSGATGALLYPIASPNLQASGYFGNVVSGVPDIDGDDVGDLLVGAVGELGSAGQAYVIAGATGVLLYPLVSPDPEASGFFGSAMAAVEDVNGDGRGDFLVGARHEDGGAPNAGRAYLYRGADALPLLIVSLTPIDPPPPVVIARGELLRYRATFTTFGAGPPSVEHWTEATFPNGSVRPISGPTTVALPPEGTVAFNFRVRVPANAPLGAYTLRMCAGTYPGDVIDCSSFPATVTAPEGLAAAGAEGDAWSSYDEGGHLLGPSAEASAAGAAAETTLRAPAPNPSGGRAVVRYTLAVAGPVRLAVYDGLGREVAVLVDGEREAGQHEAVLDGSALPAGVYLVRLTAGPFVQAQPVTLVQ